MPDLATEQFKAWAEIAQSTRTQLRTAEQSPALFKPERIEEIAQEHVRALRFMAQFGGPR